jgi:hypothetical protein
LSIQRVRNAQLFAAVALLAFIDMLPYSRIGERLIRRDMFFPPDKQPEESSTTGKTFPIATRVAWTIIVLIVTAAFALQAAGVAIPVVGRGWAKFDPARWPIELLPKLENIEQNNPNGTPIFNDLNFGGFLIYHTPRLRIFIDDRCSIYGKNLSEYDFAKQGERSPFDSWQAKYDFRYALVETGGAYDRQLVQKECWHCLEKTKTATLYQYVHKNPTISNPDPN